jgi:ankyrin repeat protein
VAVIELLLNCGALVDAALGPPEEGVTALFSACQNGHADVVSLLIAKGANVNARNVVNGVTPLIIASCFGHSAVIRLLLRAGADAKVVDLTGDTALSCAKNEEVRALLTS